jgi:hypothetical protein
MADWTPKVGDLATIKRPFHGGPKTMAEGDVVRVTHVRHADTPLVDVLLLRTGQQYYAWFATRLTPIDQPQTQKDT